MKDPISTHKQLIRSRIGMNKFFIFLVHSSLLLFSILVSKPAIAGTAEDIMLMPAGTWYEIANTDLMAQPIWNPNGVWGMGPSYIFEYSGGALDAAQNRLLVRGGGHESYTGNEIYAFNLDIAGTAKDYQWERVSTQVSKYWTDQLLADNPAGGYSNGLNGDGSPQALHTWTIIQFHPQWNALIEPTLGAFSARSTSYTNANHGRFIRYSFAANSWNVNLPALSIPVGTSGQFGTTLIDGTGNIWFFQSGASQRVYEYAYSGGDNGSWVAKTCSGTYCLSGITGWGSNFGAIDTIRNIAVLTGNGQFAVWDLSNASSPTLISTAYTGDSGLVNAKEAGIAWDSSTGLFVGWAGISGETASVYVLKVDPATSTYHFTKLPPAPSNRVTPIARYLGADGDAPFGPNGRWAYSPAQNLFVLAGRVTGNPENVKIYRLSSVTADTTLPVITAFTAGSATGTGPYSIGISAFTATDNDRVTGYAITTNPVPPKAWSAAFSPTAPTSYSVPTKGVYDLYGWAQDPHGNISRFAVITVEVATTTKTVAPSGGDFSKISDAIAWANSNGPGSIVQIDANGNPWQSWRANPGSGTTCLDKGSNFYNNVIGAITGSGITIRGINGVAKLEWMCHDPESAANDWSVQGTATHGSMITMAGGVVGLRLENLEISGAGYSGAGLWVEGLPYGGSSPSGTLYIKNCKFHDNSYGGIISGVAYNLDIVIVGSHFYDNARFYENDGQVHNIYIGESNSFTFFNSISREAYQGILVKSRAKRNYILYSRLTDEAGGLCASHAYCSDKNLDLPYGNESYVVGNIFEKSTKANSPVFVSFNPEQRFTAYFSTGGTATLTDFQNIILTNPRTGHTWKPGYIYTSPGYGFTGSWSAGTQTGAITFLTSAGAAPRYSDSSALQNEFQAGDTLIYTGGSIRVTAPGTETVGRHLKWSFGDTPINNGLYLANNTLVNHFASGNYGAYATYTYNDTAYSQSQNNVFVDLQSGNHPMLIDAYPSSPIRTAEIADYWTTSDPGFSSINSFDYSLTASAASKVGMSNRNGMQLSPVFEYRDLVTKTSRAVLGCKGAYGYYLKPGAPNLK